MRKKGSITAIHQVQSARVRNGACPNYQFKPAQSGYVCQPTEKPPAFLRYSSLSSVDACRGEARFDFAHASTSLSVPEQRRRDRPELVEGPPRPYYRVPGKKLAG